MDSILPADTFVVINKTIISEYDRRILSMLYQPIIGGHAVNLYVTLWAYLEKNNLFSSEWTHHHLITNLRTDLGSLIDSRKKLEAVGLLRTYIKEDNVNSFVYELYSPECANDFVSNPILNVTLYNNVGDSEYHKIIEYFKIPKVNLKNYKNISCRFSDIYEPVIGTNIESIDLDLKQKKRNNLELEAKIDVDQIVNSIPDEMLNSKSITKGVNELLRNISYIYNFNDDLMIELVRNSLTDKRTIDKVKLKGNASKYYKFSNGGKLPSLIYRTQPEYLRNKTNDNSNRARVIYQFETISPYDFLKLKNKGARPTKKDVDTIAHLLLDLDLNPGVVNVLIDYVLRINDNKLIKNFIDVIAAQWVRASVKTVDEAMAIAEKEAKKKYKKVEAKPVWFDKEIKEAKASVEEVSEMQELLKEFR